jgi:DNA topoisomerase-3
MMILQQAISADQVKKLLESGKTDLLDGFVSARTRRKFKAFLVKTPEGKIGFEFEARPAKSPKASAGEKTEASKAPKASRSRARTKAA